MRRKDVGLQVSEADALQLLQAVKLHALINKRPCGTLVDPDLRVKPCDPEASIRVALREARCPRSNGHGRPRVAGLAAGPSM